MYILVSSDCSIRAVKVLHVNQNFTIIHMDFNITAADSVLKTQHPTIISAHEFQPQLTMNKALLCNTMRDNADPIRLRNY